MTSKTVDCPGHHLTRRSACLTHFNRADSFDFITMSGNACGRQNNFAFCLIRIGVIWKFGWRTLVISNAA